MHKFVFPLENTLEYRVSVEEHETKLLVKAMQKVQAEERTLAKLNNEKQTYLSSCSNAKSNLTKLQQQEAYLNWLNFRVKEQIKKLEEAKKFLENQRIRMLEASVKRKSLELVKEKCFDEYHFALSKEEQNILDDVGIAAYCRKD